MEPGTRLFGSVCLLGLGLVVAVKIVLPLAAPFVAGLILACLFEPLVSWCERVCRLPRAFASALVLMVALCLLGLCLITIGVNLWFGLRDLTRGIARGGTLDKLFDSLAKAGAVGLAGLPEPIRNTLLGGTREIPIRLAGFFEHGLESLSHLPELIIIAFFSMLAAFFFSRDRELMSRFLISLVPREWRSRAVGMKKELLHTLMGFVRTQLLLVLLTCCLGTLGLTALGTKYAILYGLLLGVLDFLPMIGPGALLLPWSGLSLVLGDWVRSAGLITLFVVLAFVRQAAEARLIGRNLGLHPLAVLAAVYIGTRLFGLSGVLLGPVIVVIMRAVHETAALADGNRARRGAKEVNDETDCHPRFNRIHRAPNT